MRPVRARVGRWCRALVMARLRRLQDGERALSGWLGIPVLPLGRHSVMNGVILAGDATEVDKEEFAAALTGLARGWARLKNWGHAEAMGLACRLATDDEQVRVHTLAASLRAVSKGFRGRHRTTS